MLSTLVMTALSPDIDSAIVNLVPATALLLVFINSITRDSQRIDSCVVNQYTVQLNQYRDWL